MGNRSEGGEGVLQAEREEALEEGPWNWTDFPLILSLNIFILLKAGQLIEEGDAFFLLCGMFGFYY